MRIARVSPWWPVAAAFLACLAFYVFMTVTSADVAQSAGPGVYDRLADAFLHGRLSVDVKPPPGLLHLANPFDPAQNEPFRQYPWEDLSLYKGRFYAYWGPVPALVLFAPVRLVGLGHLPEAVAALILCAGALVMSTLLVVEIARRWLPGLNRWLLALAVLAMGTGNGVLLLLAPGHVWQVASAGGIFFMLAAIVVLLRAARRGGGLGSIALASLWLGLAVGSRWSLAPVCVAWALLFPWLRGQLAARRGDAWPLALALLGPLAACIGGLAVYNLARFGSLTQTGIGLQITAVNWHDQSLIHPDVLPLGLFYYLLIPVLVTPLFPYFWQNTKEYWPGTFQHVEPTAGLLWITPILLFVLVAPFVLRGRPQLRRVFAFAAATGGVLLLIVAAIPASAMRYNADYGTFLVLAALVVWLGPLTGRRLRRPARRTLVAAGGLLCVWGIVVNAALAISAGNVLRIESPGTFDSLETFFAPIPSVASRVLGRPLLASVESFPILPARRPGMHPDSFGIQRTLHVEVVNGGANSDAVLVAKVSAVGGAATVRIRSAGGAVAEAPADGRVHAIPLRLERGLNRILVERVPQAAEPDSAYVLLDHLRVRGA